MPPGRLQRWIDELHSMSNQRWLLWWTATFAPVIAYGATATASHRFAGPLAVMIAALSALAATRPDSPAPLVVIGFLILVWAGVVEDLTTAWVLVSSIALFAFHTATALMSTTPHDAEVDVATMRLWAGRFAGVSAVTVVVWLLVLALDRLHPNGSAVLLFAALAVVVLSALWLRARSLGEQ